jgi:hypothetical protein
MFRIALANIQRADSPQASVALAEHTIGEATRLLAMRYKPVS